jgi:hypothetical protein
MTDKKKENLRAKTIELAEEAKKLVLEKIDKVFNTNGNGSIDIDQYDDDNSPLPKIVLYAVFKDVAETQIRPVHHENLKAAENLYRVI